MKTTTLAIIMLLFAMSIQAQFMKYVYDPKTQAMVGANSSAASGQELIYSNEIDKQKEKREGILTKASMRNLVKSFDLAARKNIGDFGKQSVAFNSLCIETERLGVAIGKLLAAGEKSPENYVYCYKSAMSIFLEAKEAGERAIFIGMNGKVPNPFKNLDLNSLKTGTIELESSNADSDSETMSRKSDGLNLIMANDRLSICNEAIWKLRQLRRMCTVMTIKLQCDYRWTHLIKEASPYDYYWAIGTKAAAEKVMKDIINFPIK